MSTKIRAAISPKNKYWISKHRFYELKHFCLQYKEWEKAYKSIELLPRKVNDQVVKRNGAPYKDITADCAIALVELSKKMELIEKTAYEADPELKDYIIMGVTEELSYDTLLARESIPCSRETYYDRFRKFFWLLHKARN